MPIRIPPMKHIIMTQQNAVNLSTQGTYILAVGTENPDPYTNVTNVRNGSIIRQIILQIDFANTSTADNVDAIDWYVWFNINGAQTKPSNTNPNASHLKNQIFHQDGALLPVKNWTNVGFQYAPVAKWRVVINIPRTYQQINLGDTIELVMTSQINAANMSYKITAIYKEIYP